MSRVDQEELVAIRIKPWAFKRTQPQSNFQFVQAANGPFTCLEGQVVVGIGIDQYPSPDVGRTHSASWPNLRPGPS